MSESIVSRDEHAFIQIQRKHPLFLKPENLLTAAEVVQKEKLALKTEGFISIGHIMLEEDRLYWTNYTLRMIYMDALIPGIDGTGITLMHESDCIGEQARALWWHNNVR